jgi:hypothetical protein
MNKRIGLVIFPAVCSLLAANPEPTPTQVAFFESKVRPILVNNCYECHSEETQGNKGGLYLDTREGVLQGGKSGPAVVPGKPEASLLLKAVKHLDKKLRMPQKQPKLPGQQIAILEKWIKMGAPDPRKRVLPSLITRNIDIEEGRKFWSFQPVRKPNVPKVRGSWAHTDLDRFVQAGHAKKGLQPVKDSPPAALLRRIYFDLTGLPPSPDQVSEFITTHGRDSKTAVKKIVDRLLESNHFGERWGRHWMDVARYAESTGMERNCTYTQAWRYRDYVIQAFNKDKPFDQFIREQVAGDLMAADTTEKKGEHLVATGFLALGPKSLNSRDVAQFKADVVDEQIDITTRAFMGLTVSCARCHDHKFDPIPTQDYYAIAGIFHSTKTLFGTGGTGNRQKSTLMPLGGENDGLEEAIKIHQGRTRDKKGEMADNTRKTRELQQSIKQKEAAERKIIQQELVQLKKQKGKLAKALKKLTKEKPKSTNVAMAAQENPKIADARINIRGDVRKLGKPVERGYLSVVQVPNASPVNKAQSGRLELADWIASPKNPLTSRVLANRIWQHLFGEGIVRSVDNFGKTGERPDDPVLLDYLATRVVANEWSVKKTIREIMLSRTYALSSEPDEKNFKADPENRFWWKAHHRRLDAEALRDATLAASGQLDTNPVKGSPVMALGEINVGRETKNMNKVTAANRNRSVYHPILRNKVPDSLRLFDFAEPSIIVGRRQVTTVPTQALYLLNSPFILKQSGHMAKRIQDAGTEGTENQVRQAFRLSLGREPTDPELKRMQAYLDSEGKSLGNICQVLLASAEFRYLE